jgi:site-specific DNA recombinase
MTTRRAAIYARVSTVRQAEADISMPDQVERCRLYCESKGWIVSEIFEEPGASALDDDRPVFKRMIEAAKHEPRYFDVVVVHSFSRFSRDALHSELYIRTLRKSGVELISISQEVTADPMGEIVRRILNMLDELQSRENAKHTSRAMLANATQGFWNGAPPPFGYGVEIAEWRGKKAKKRLAIEPLEADQVREVFELAAGERFGRPLGIKEICKLLNSRGSRRRGRPWGIGSLHGLLRDPTYVGRRFFNMFDTRNKQPRPQSEWVVNPTPPIVSEELFSKVQSSLTARRATTIAPRLVNGPTLLAGIVRCECCGGAMVINTGKGGRYRYYSCSTRLKQGATQCVGNRVPMDWLDGVVLDELTERVFTPERLRSLVEGYVATAAKRLNKSGEDVVRLDREIADVVKSLGNLLRLVETGAVSADDPILKPRIADLTKRRDQLMAEQEIARKPARQAERMVIDEKKLDVLVQSVGDRLRNGDPKVRQTYFRKFVSAVRVSGTEIHISGMKSALAEAAISGQVTNKTGVLSFVPEWRPLGDSNPCHHRERVVS